MTSWLTTKTKRTAIYDTRYLSSSVRAGGGFCEMLGGVYQRDTKTLLISGTCPYSLYYGSTTPTLWSVLWSTGTILCYFECTVLCTGVLQVWQDFICFVVLRLLSRSTNFHSSKHIRNYTQDRLVNYEIHARVVCFCFPLLISKQNY